MTSIPAGLIDEEAFARVRIRTLPSCEGEIAVAAPARGDALVAIRSRITDQAKTRIDGRTSNVTVPLSDNLTDWIPGSALEHAMSLN